MPMSEIHFLSNKLILHTVFAKSIYYKILSFLGHYHCLQNWEKTHSNDRKKKLLATEIFLYGLTSSFFRTCRPNISRQIKLVLEHSIVIGIGFILNHRKATASLYYYRDVDCLWFSAKECSLYLTYCLACRILWTHLHKKKNSYFASK